MSEDSKIVLLRKDEKYKHSDFLFLEDLRN